MEIQNQLKFTQHFRISPEYWAPYRLLWAKKGSKVPNFLANVHFPSIVSTVRLVCDTVFINIVPVLTLSHI